MSFDPKISGASIPVVSLSLAPPIASDVEHYVRCIQEKITDRGLGREIIGIVPQSPKEWPAIGAAIEQLLKEQKILSYAFGQKDIALIQAYADDHLSHSSFLQPATPWYSLQNPGPFVPSHYSATLVPLPNPFDTTNDNRKKIFEEAHQKAFDSRVCDQLMGQFLEVFEKNEPMGSNYIPLKDLYKWLGDGTTPTSQHFWRYLGSHTNPSWGFQNTMIIQELSATQLPHFIAGLRDNKTELVGRWTGDAYVLAVLQQAMTHGGVNKGTFAILEAIKQEIEAQDTGVVPADRFDRKAVREKELLAAKGLLSPEVYQKLLQGKYTLLPFHAMSNGFACSDNSRELFLQGNKDQIETCIRQFLFKEVTEGDSYFGPMIDDRQPDWLAVWLEKKGEGYTHITVERKDVPRDNSKNKGLTLKLTAQQAAECQKGADATQVVFNVRATLIDTASEKIFEIIANS